MPEDPPLIDVLVIDDDPLCREFMLRALATKGYSSCWAANGRDALVQLARNRLRLVVTDTFMPRLDGIELLIASRRSQPSIPVIVVSGGGRAAEPEAVLRPARILGAKRTLAKPFEVQEFLAVVGELLAEQRSKD